MLESLHQRFPHAELHLVVRQGNESLFDRHPFLAKVWVWEKKSGKYKSLWRLGRALKKQSFDAVINLHRFASSGFLTAMTSAPVRKGFAKNPLSIWFTESFPHQIGTREDGSFLHETERNHLLIAEWCGKEASLPRLYPDPLPIRPFWAENIRAFLREEKIVLIAPASVWKTKAFPAAQWVRLIDRLHDYRIGMIGAPGDRALADEIIVASHHPDAHNFCGHLGLLESAKLMRAASMTYVNDSAPMHLATSVQALVTAVYCSTVPAFGFGPKGPDAHVVETREALSCRPCGLHGRKACPEGHFKCALNIHTEQLLEPLGHKKAR